MQLNCICFLGVAGMLTTTTAAADERPSAWLFRATPGFGYARDVERRCAIRGPATVGGWSVGKFVTPSLNVGGGMNAVIGGADRGCMLPEDRRMAFGIVIGPNVDWYPTDRGLHASAHAGFANYQQNITTSSDYGAGGTLAVGYDWADGHTKSGDSTRFGLALQVNGMRMIGGHAIVIPALVMTIGVD